MQRTDLRHDSVEQVGPAFDAIYRRLVGVPLRETALLVDLRAVVGRNDPAFEVAVAPHRRTLLTAFRRTGILLRSPIGMLQLRRFLREDGVEAALFADEAEALRWLTTNLAP